MLTRILVIIAFCALVITGLVLFERVVRRRQREGGG